MRSNLFLALMFLTSTVFASDFTCKLEFTEAGTNTSTLTLESVSEQTQGSLGGYDVAIQYASNDGYKDHYNFSISGPRANGLLISGTVIQDCGIGTRSLIITCKPIR